MTLYAYPDYDASRAPRRARRRWALASALLAGAGLAFVACGGSSDGDSGGDDSSPNPLGGADGNSLGGTTGGDPCASDLKGKCGAVCTGASTGCATGLYCSTTGACIADCSAGVPCASGSCTTDGHCPSDGPGGTGTGGGGNCPSTTVQVTKIIPTVVLLIDQSGSMSDYTINGTEIGTKPGQAPPGTPTRWDTLKKELTDPGTGVIKQLQDDVRFGLTLYSWDPSKDGSHCPALKDVSPALDNYNAIEATYGPATTSNNTPTGESINKVVPGLLAVKAAGPKYIVLATDGDPDTCAGMGSDNGQDGPKKVSLDAVTNAYKQGIGTFVIALAGNNEVSSKHLQELANAGQGKSPDDPGMLYFDATAQDKLAAAFEQIIGSVRSCQFKLNGTVDDTSQAGQGTVSVDGKSVGYNDPNGWKLDGNDTVELLGSSCSAIKTGDHQVDVSFPCGVKISPVH